MKILITGISGFVARHFLELLSVSGEHSVAGLYNKNRPAFGENDFPGLKLSFHQVDLVDGEELKEIFIQFQPTHILHLASQSSVAYSWENPADCIRENIAMFLNVVDYVRLLNMKCRILSIGSAEEYGNVDEALLPLKETANPNPVSPYGVSRLMQEKIVEIYSRNYGLDIIHTRSFNHIGPYQTEKFVVSSFAKQIATQVIEGNDRISISTGDMEVVRDFTDVRDVVKAYFLLLTRGRKGSIYNVCSGNGYVLKDLLKKFELLTGVPIQYRVNEKFIRPTENRIIIGNYEKIKSETGWEPSIPIEQSLDDLLNYWKSELFVERPS
jgi:GDP-4-dehydro-6-deoxy-D-mannose reductase